MAPEDVKEYKQYDPIEIEIKNGATGNLITCKGHFIKYNRNGKVLIYVHEVIMEVPIERISKV